MGESFLDRYFGRIQYGGSPRVDVETLRDLHLLHLKEIPYENLDVFCLRGVRLDAETLMRKILLRRRGGYCFEQNGLFLAALTALGFKCHPNMARVHRNRPQPGGRTHQINLVELEGETWVCDVGFGGSAFRYPLPLRPDVEFEQLGEVYRFHVSEPHGFYLQRKSGGAWHPLYTFRVEAALPIDMEIANFYTGNSADHVFLNSIRGTRMTERGRVTVLDHTFRAYDLMQGTVRQAVVGEFAAYLEQLREHLGVELDQAERTALQARFAALKAPGC